MFNVFKKILGIIVGTTNEHFFILFLLFARPCWVYPLIIIKKIQSQVFNNKNGLNFRRESDFKTVTVQFQMRHPTGDA